MNAARPVTLSWRDRSSGPGPRSIAVRDDADDALRDVAFADPSGQGELYRGDNARVLRALAARHGATASLVYMDPPFLTNRVHDAVLRKTLPAGANGDSDDGAPKSGARQKVRVAAFDDRWADRASYLEALGARIEAARDVLAPHGSLVLHVDPKTSHYVKVLCDEIFGEDAFASEIIWRYRRWPSKTENFQRVHDVLLRYRKDVDAAPRWTQLYEPLAASTVATWGTNKQRAEFAADGTRKRSQSTSAKSEGVPMGDVWEIGVLAPISRERTGYPSQKPEALLERLLRALTLPGDLVVDPYAGSGTTLAAAAKLGRRYVGIDQSEVALDIARERLARMVALPEAGGLGCGR